MVLTLYSAWVVTLWPTTIVLVGACLFEGGVVQWMMKHSEALQQREALEQSLAAVTLCIATVH